MTRNTPTSEILPPPLVAHEYFPKYFKQAEKLKSCEIKMPTVVWLMVCVVGVQCMRYI